MSADDRAQGSTAQAPTTGERPRLWPAVVLIALFWSAIFIASAVEKPYFVGFMLGMAAPALLVLVYSIWWWRNRRIPLGERAWGCFLVIATGLSVAPLCHPSVRFGLLTIGLPLALTALTLWMLVVQWTDFASRRLGLAVVLLPTWGYFALVRIDGLDADLKATSRWRWAPTPEEVFLAERAQSAKAAAPLPAATTPLALSPGDWPAFRGPDREGVIRGVTIDPDWSARLPKQLWRRRVGPAWSSVIVIGDRLFTQEQRGEEEAVVCYDAATGDELWSHADRARFWESVSGAGPRATPTFAEGRLFTLGATGILNCLDAATGGRHWTRDIAAEAGAHPPGWGYSSSPLVVNDRVIVFAGGESGRNLLAYNAASGELTWAAAASPDSYASPQLAVIGGRPQCLLLGDHGLSAVDPATGAALWQFGWEMAGAPRTVQAHVLGPSRIAAGTLSGPGVALVDVTSDGDQWRVTEVWSSTQMKPEFPDFVVHEGYAYGFDGAIFCCLDLAGGQRKWKKGRYGRGQVVLLAEQGLLLVVSEEGDVILLAADPKQHAELGRFRAIEGKTWNHPVIAHGRLFVRNAEEMACYEL